MKKLTMDDVLNMNGVDGGSGSRIWIAIDHGDKTPSVMDFITGCTSIAKAKKYLSCDEAVGGRKLGIFDWKSGKWVDL